MMETRLGYIFNFKAVFLCCFSIVANTVTVNAHIISAKISPLITCSAFYKAKAEWMFISLGEVTTAKAYDKISDNILDIRLLEIRNDPKTNDPIVKGYSYTPMSRAKDSHKQISTQILTHFAQSHGFTNSFENVNLQNACSRLIGKIL